MGNAEISEDGIKLLSLAEQWEDRKVHEGGDKRVIKFISEVLFHGAPEVNPEDAVESVRNLFEAGYCYYFARMLEDAFPGGVACLCYPFGHIVYIYEGIAYDINGISDSEHEYYVPISELGKAIDSFRHVPDDSTLEQSIGAQSNVFSAYELEKELIERSEEDKIAEIVSRCVKEGRIVKAKYEIKAGTLGY